MLEESISCSPGNCGKKSRSRRFHKNAKKKCELYNETSIVDNIIPSELSSLEALYEESENSGIKNAKTHIEFFSPFESEMLLAAADRAEASTSSSKLQNLTSKGFIRLQSLPFKEENKTFPMKPPDGYPQGHTDITPRSPQVLGPETQFGITESEFVRFCDDAASDILVQLTSDVKNQRTSDVMLKNSNSAAIEVEVGTKKIRKSVVEEILRDFCGSPTESEIEEQTPAKNIKPTKSIVDEILEDFCGSPYIDSSPKVNSDDSTPIFRFKSKPIRTYSGLRKKKLFPRNIATDLNAFTLKDDGNTSDSSSGLSVQEDLSQSVVPQLDTVDLNNSVKLCENLQNLSSYFSQLTPSSSKEKSPPSIVDEKKDLRLSAIIEQIIEMKSKSLTINCNRIEEEFMGFSDYENDSKESTLQELLEDEDDVLQQINCDSLCYEKVEPKDSLTHIDLDIENTLQNASALIEKAKALMLPKLDVNQKVQNSGNMYQTDCDTDQDVQSKLLSNYSLKDEQLFEDVDIWNDNECLLNYKTQKHHTKRVKNEANDLINYEFNENKDSETTNSTMQTSKSDNKAELFNLSYCNNWESLNDQQNLTDSCTLKLSETSRNNKKFKTNKGNLSECEKGEIEQITDIDAFPGTRINFSVEENSTNINLADNKCLSKSSTFESVGFATVSKKPILISDKARQKANEFLRKFEQQECEEMLALNKNKDEVDMEANKFVCNISTKPQTDYQDLANHSSVSIQPTHRSLLSKKDCGENGMREIMNREIVFKEINVNKQEQCNTSCGYTEQSNILNNNCSVGFSTASKKIISISNRAKQKADDILKKFEQDEQEKGMLVTTNKYIGNKRKEKHASEEHTKSNLKVCDFVGFSTASEKPIAISLEAKRKADEMLKKFEQAEKIEQDNKDMGIEKLTQRHPNEVSEEVRRKAQELLVDIEFFEEAFEDELKKIEEGPMSQLHDEKRRAESTVISTSCKEFTHTPKEHIFEGFKTASKKSIHVSEEASKRAESFFKAVYDEDVPQEFLKCIESDINNTNISGIYPMDRVEQVDGAIKSPRNHLHDASKTESDGMHANTDLEMKIKSPLYAYEDKMIDQRTPDSAFGRLCKKKKDCFNDDQVKNLKNRKRKHSEGHELEKSSSFVTPRRLSCGERTPLNRIENGLLSKSSSMPLKECTPNSTIISRKNLLSLSKRKKLNTPGQIAESKAGPKTPRKEQHSSITNNIASSTPNLKSFFECVSTSTPRMIRNNPTKQNSSNDTIDSDFQQIQWEDLNNSFRINRTGCVDDVNVTFSEVSPSPKQRIDRLKMYGEPPPVSPILMINKCRHSGLRRGRSLMKP